MRVHQRGWQGALSIPVRRSFFGSVREVDFARSGNVATRTVKVSKGPLEETPFSMAEELRKLGLPIELRHGVVNLIADKTICKEGDVLTPEQCRLLV